MRITNAQTDTSGSITFPATWELGRKDRLGRNLIKARRRGPEFLTFNQNRSCSPQTRTTGDWRHLQSGRYVHPQAPRIFEGQGNQDVQGAQGHQAREECPHSVVTSRPSPHQWQGYDIRVYVALTSLDPLRVYVYKEGLVRLATEKYTEDGEDLKRRCMHLTNYTIN